MNTQRNIVLVGIGLLVLKFVAYFLTRSNAILTDALESIINVLAGGFGLFARYLSGLPKDENHPYGHGKIEFISASVEGSLIAIAGALMMYTAILALWQPRVLEQLNWGLFLVALTGIVNFVMGRHLVASSETEKSPAMHASGKHLISDAYTTAALFVGLAIILFTQIMWLDSILAFAMGVLLAQTGFNIVKTAVSGIMDETNYQLATDIIAWLQNNRKANWIDIHNFRIIQYGSALHIDCHITVPYYFTVVQAHDVLKEIEATLDANTERAMEVFIHTDPCMPEISCAICAKTDCTVRQKPFAQHLAWTLDNVLRNEKHGSTVFD